LRSATTVAAEILQRKSQLGIVAPGAIADLLVVQGDPLKDINVLVGQGERLEAIVKDGRFIKNELSERSTART
jgi:imidazolonepropionase-like amidohydrolase